MRKIRDLTFGALAMLILASSLNGAVAATDYKVLREDQRVHEELLAASLAYLINRYCPELKIRRLKVTAQALSLRSYAKTLGYTGAEVDAFVKNDDERDRMRAIATALLVEKGVVVGDAASYCTVGRAEIEADTETGGMLRGG